MSLVSLSVLCVYVLVACSAHHYIGALRAHRQVIAIVVYTELAGSAPPEVAPSKLLGSYLALLEASGDLLWQSFWGALLGTSPGKLLGNALGSILVLGVLWSPAYSGVPILLLA